MTNKRIAVWGGGAIGATIAAHVARAAHDVTLVDVATPHIDAINTNGLRIDLPEGTVSVRLPALHPADMTGPCDIIFLAVKAHLTMAAAEQIRHVLASDGCVVSLQNGLCELELAAALGAERVVGAFINFGADVVGPGHIVVGNRGAVVTGEIDGRMTARLAEVHALLSLYEPRAIQTDTIFGYLWGKQAYSSVLKSSALGPQPLVEFLDDLRWRDANIALIREVLSVARAEGINPIGFDGYDPTNFEGTQLQAEIGLTAIADPYRMSSKSHSSAWMDLAGPSRRTDAAAQVAPVLALAQKHGIPVPRLAGLIRRISSVEAGDAHPSFDLLSEWVSD